MGVRDTRFNLNGVPLRSLAENEATNFLGAQVGFQVIPPIATIAGIIEVGLKIERSKLAPLQRLDTLKTFFYPSAVHIQWMGTFQKSD